ncbi:MAG: methylated-DNA--[protein]-cysteine S-methyltransferase [Methanosarcinales archaeon]|nr:MAG: methylated-DNA--[protein]-cysteine S-methyltransferase [Methanosarcinales archaeon]
MPHTLSRDNLTVTITLYHNTIREITLSKARHGLKKAENTIYLLNDIGDYLDGKRVDFLRYSVDLENLTDFQQLVLNKVRQIPYGVTVTYGMLAKDLQTSPRAIGGALSKNPAPIVIPCHRVIGKHDLGGFAWGVMIKKHLLHVEGASIGPDFIA